MSNNEKRSQEEENLPQKAFQSFIAAFAVIGLGAFYYYDGLGTDPGMNSRVKLGQILMVIAHKLGGSTGLYTLLGVLAFIFFTKGVIQFRRGI